MAPSGRDQSKITKKELQKLIDTAFVPGISFAAVVDNKIYHEALGLLDAESKEEKRVNSDTQFWACSLSKPVFAYLVLKLIEKKQLGSNFNLKTPLPWAKSILGPQGKKKSFTVEMILSHQTGLPNEGPPDQLFKESKPGEMFRYSGEGYLYLQKFILNRTGKKSLDDLAKQHIFVPLEMSRSSFSFPENENNFAKTHDEAMISNPLPKTHSNHNNAAGSLHTTASDYARFLTACLNDAEFIKLVQVPKINSMERDIDSKSKVSSSTLSRIDWGFGFGLQKDEKGKISSAFHWGHGPGARTFFAINLHSKSAVVYLTNSENGLSFAEELASSIVGDIAPAMKFLSEKYNYKRIDSEGWKEYHDYLIAGAKSEKMRDFRKAFELYSQALEIFPESKDLQYRILLSSVHCATPVTLDAGELNKIKGQYGPVQIFMANSKLKIKIGGECRDLKVISSNTFLDGNVILKINSFLTPPMLMCHFPGGGICNYNRDPDLSSTSVSIKKLKISSRELKHAATDVDMLENKDSPKKYSDSEASIINFSYPVAESDEVSNEEMAKSSFGQGSNTAKRLK